MAQFLRPDSDGGSSGTWVTVPTTPTTWFDKIDETVASDADYVWNSNTISGRYFEVGLSNPLETPLAGSHTIRWRVSDLVSGGKARLKPSSFSKISFVCVHSSGSGMRVPPA